MKANRTYLFIVISSIALLVVLVIQVNWILQTARIKEELFNEKANMVLARTAETLSADPEACRQLETGTGINEIRKTDSLFTNYMEFYDFKTDYSFAVTAPGSAADAKTRANVYKKRLEEEASQNGLELNLFLPGRKQFIIAEMGPMFITSVILILVVLFMFWRTIRSLMKEKKISEHTTDFLNNMTHEFKTPLTNIALAGKMMMKDSITGHEDKIKHYSGIILEENEKLRMQVEQVLSMTALERGEIPIQKVDLNFHELIEEAIKCISIQVENAHGELVLDFKAEECMVQGDKTHLKNAICNLIDNAIKYANGKPELLIRTYNKHNDFVVEIADKGIGIAKEYQDKIFDKFFRVPTGDVHDVKGFGLGLSYVKKIIELHGGSLELVSEKNKGATFTIILPHD